MTVMTDEPVVEVSRPLNLTSSDVTNAMRGRPCGSHASEDERYPCHPRGAGGCGQEANTCAAGNFGTKAGADLPNDCHTTTTDTTDTTDMTRRDDSLNKPSSDNTYTPIDSTESNREGEEPAVCVTTQLQRRQEELPVVDLGHGHDVRQRQGGKRVRFQSDVQPLRPGGGTASHPTSGASPPNERARASSPKRRRLVHAEYPKASGSLPARVPRRFWPAPGCYDFSPIAISIVLPFLLFSLGGRPTIVHDFTSSGYAASR